MWRSRGESQETRADRVSAGRLAETASQRPGTKSAGGNGESGPGEGDSTVRNGEWAGQGGSG